MHFFWSDTPKAEIPQEELLTEEEMKARFESVSQFMLEYQKQYFDGLKFSLNMWMLINSGTAFAIINIGNNKYLNIAIMLMIGTLITGALSVFLGNAINNRIVMFFNYVLNSNMNIIEFYLKSKNLFISLKKTMQVLLLIPYAIFGYSIVKLSIRIYMP